MASRLRVAALAIRSALTLRMRSARRARSSSDILRVRFTNGRSSLGAATTGVSGGGTGASGITGAGAGDLADFGFRTSFSSIYRLWRENNFPQK